MYEGALPIVAAGERLERITDTAAGSGAMKANKSRQIFRTLKRISESDGIARAPAKATTATLAALGIKVVKEGGFSNPPVTETK